MKQEAQKKTKKLIENWKTEVTSLTMELFNKMKELIDEQVEETKDI